LNSEETTHPHEGEVVYADDKEVLCRRWNWRESDKSKMTEEIKHAVLVVEGLPPASKEEVETAAQELKGLIERHCGGEASVHLLNKEKAELSL
jgi:lysyl-tRNA synthetase class 2